jgi:glucokinase
MFLGIEIGGTKLQLGVGHGDGTQLVALVRYPVRREAGAAGILAQILELAAPLIEQHGVTRVGFGFGGPVDPGSGRVRTSHQVAGWDGHPLTAWTQEQLGIPAVLGNDCDCAALAEAWFGAGVGRNSLLYITVGTGIGGGLVIGGQLHGAGRAAAAEIGHLRPGPDAVSPGQTVEAVASGPGLARHARRLLERETDPAVRDGLLDLCDQDASRLTAREIAEAARAGNRLALATLGEATRWLGWAVAQAITLIAPEIVVVGGGVSLVGESLFFEPLRTAVEQYVFGPLRGTYRIVPAALGEQVVVHGALALAATGGA